MKQSFLLTDAERASPLWERLMRHMEERISAVSRENEKPEYDQAQTALRRGQIKSFRELMRLDEAPRIQELPPES